MKKTASGEDHERAKGLYAGVCGCARAASQVGLDLCLGRSPFIEVETNAQLGGNPRGDDQTLAQGRQERGWRARAALACGFICAISSLAVGQGLSLAADGRALAGECRG